MYKKWIYKENSVITKELAEAVNNDFLAKLLAQRGITNTKRLTDFLEPLKMNIISPYMFKDMQKSVERISSAIENQEQIIIWGDFDADGVTSTATLYKTLTHLGAKVDYYIPSRETENHGLNTKALVKLISKNKVKLLITVDCGVSNFKEVNFLNGFNVDVIITDHHDFTGELPPAYAILNPKIKDNLDESLTMDEITYLSYLAGVGVSFKLSCALLEKYEKIEFTDEVLPFVALGTIADVVPLLGENRCFVMCGLSLIANNKNKGIAKLLEVGGYKAENITSDTIAFGLAPRINAAGRLKTADVALKILLSDSESEIAVAAEELNCLNVIRQELCDKIFEEAVAQINPKQKDSAIVLLGQGWHIGIIGIVASKVVEHFNKPVFMMTQADEDSTIIRCSARSIEGVNLYESIKANEELFTGFGGHKLAAGLAFDKAQHSFDEVRKKLCTTISNMTAGLDLTPVKMIDLEVSPKDLNFEFIDLINKLQPFGECNEFPLISMNDCTLKHFRTMGESGKHSKLMIEKDNTIFEAVWWNNSEKPVEEGEKLDLAFYPKINEYNSRKTVQLDIQDLHFEGCDKIDEVEPSLIKVYDHRQKSDIFAQVNEYLGKTTQNILLFAQQKKTTDKLLTYKNLAPQIRNKTNISKADQIMFFDYPTSDGELKFILEEVMPTRVHFMYKVFGEIVVDDLLKTVSGMLKYVHNNKGGLVEVGYLSSVLGITDECLNVILKLFAKTEIIEIENCDEEAVTINFLAPKGINLLHSDELYSDIVSMIDEINKYTTYLLTCEKEELENIVTNFELKSQEQVLHAV